jgi:hypothetical protein
MVDVSWVVRIVWGIDRIVHEAGAGVVGREAVPDPPLGLRLAA